MRHPPLCFDLLLVFRIGLRSLCLIYMFLKFQSWKQLFSYQRSTFEEDRMSSRGRTRYSRSRSRSPRYTRRYSRSRSRSYSPKSSRAGPSRKKSHSRSPMSGRRRHIGSRDAPEEGTCLGVFGLSLYTTERELEKEFSKFGPLEKVQVVLDGKVWTKYGT